MALVLDELAAEMRLDTPVEEPTAGILTRLMGVGSALVDLHGSEAPDAVQDEAVIRLCAYLYDQPESPSGTRYATAWRKQRGRVSRGAVGKPKRSRFNSFRRRQRDGHGPHSEIGC